MALVHYLINKYGLEARPGKKHFCPICNAKRKTFSMKSDGTVAKCFKCGSYMVLTDWGVYDSTDHHRPAA